MHAPSRAHDRATQLAKCVPRVAQDAAVLDVIDKLGRSAALVSTLDTEEGPMDEGSLVPAKKLTKLAVAVTRMSVAASKRPTPQTTSVPAAQAAPAGAPSVDV